METLEQEKFDTLKELADLQTNISTGRAEFEKLKETTEEYMVVREKEAEERVLGVLEKSRDALEETTNNHRELSGFNRDLTAYANELSVLATDITALFKDFNKTMDDADKTMSDHRESANEAIKQAKVIHSGIKSDRQVLALERADISEQWKLLKDRQETLKAGFKELKNK